MTRALFLFLEHAIGLDLLRILALAVNAPEYEGSSKLDVASLSPGINFSRVVLA